MAILQGVTRWRDYVQALVVFLATLSLMILTESRLAIVWDEGYSLGREARIRLWFRALKDPTAFAATWKPPAVDLVQSDRNPQPPPRPDQIDSRSKLFQTTALQYFWPFAREEPHGHPPFYALVGLIGDQLAPSWEKLPRARLGPMLAFSLTATALFLFFQKRWGLWPALTALGAWVFQPNLFGHAHYATYDALLTCLWVGAILAFWKAIEPVDPSLSSIPKPRWRWVLLFGIVVGWALDTKLTACFLPIPFAIWLGLYRNRRGPTTLLVGGIVAIVVLLLFNPPWWLDPIGGVDRYLRSNLSRASTIRIKTMFLGQIYSTPDGSLPWYNTLAWTLFVTPIGFLLLALSGFVTSIRKSKVMSFGVLVSCHWILLLTLRSLPHTPGHDGVRQFLPAFGCLTILAGIGAAVLQKRLPKWGPFVVSTALVEGLISVALMMPVPLSYFSPIIGGLPGATALGMEPTYYWDALTPEALAWINQNTPSGEKVAFANMPSSWWYLKQSGRLRPEFDPRKPGRYAWYVVQNRPGTFSDLDRTLIRDAKPAYVVQKWNVPLLWIFPFSQVEQWQQAQPRTGLAP